MGCGASKAVPVAENAPAAAPKKVVVEESKSHTSAASAAAPASQGIIDENTDGGEVIASHSMNESVDLAVSGTKVAAGADKGGKGAAAAAQAAAPSAGSPERGSSDDDSTRGMSAVSTRSAPTVLQRPSSRGGSAYDLQFDESEGGQGQKRMPRRLEQLRSDKQRQKKEQSLEELQRKYEAAEKRKRDYESKIKAKMADEIEKSEKILAQRSGGESSKETPEKENKALENREAHLKSLRDKLRAKEEHAQKVRDNKRAQASAN